MLLHAGIAQVLEAILRRAEHRIHTGRDTVFQEENIELLRRGALILAAEGREEQKSLDR